MIEFQAAPKQDATDLRVMLEEEREARERELLKEQEVERKRHDLKKAAKQAYADYKLRKKADLGAKITLYAIYGLMLAAVPVAFTAPDFELHPQAVFLAVASVPTTVALVFVWKVDEARKLKKQAIAARERFENFDVSQKEVAE